MQSIANLSRIPGFDSCVHEFHAYPESNAMSNFVAGLAYDNGSYSLKRKVRTLVFKSRDIKLSQ